MKHKIGIVLPGGGSKGARQVGALKAIDESGLFDVKIVSGTSVGALNGSMYAQEENTSTLEHIWLNQIKGNSSIYRHHIPFSVLQGLFKKGLFCAKPLRKLIDKNLNLNDFIDSQIQFLLATSNLGTGEIEYYRNIPEHADVIKQHVYSSAAYPIFFETETVGGYEYWDGGIGEQAPLRELIRTAKREKLKLDYIFVIMTNETEMGEVNDFGPLLFKRIARVLSMQNKTILADDIRHKRLMRNMVKFIYPNPQMIESSLSFNPDNIRMGFNEGFSTTKHFISENF